jgi:hypothetical protein
MTVYVDSMRAPLGRMVMCHMIADTEDELHAMAGRIGMRREWFQHGDIPWRAHYDVALGKRALEVKLGAEEITWRQASMMCAIRRDTGSLGKPETCEAVFRDLLKARDARWADREAAQ